MPVNAGGNGTTAPHLPQAGDVSHSTVSQVSSSTSALPAFGTGLASLKDALLSLSYINLRSLWRNSYPQESSPFPVIVVFSRERKAAVMFELIFFL